MRTAVLGIVLAATLANAAPVRYGNSVYWLRVQRLDDSTFANDTHVPTVLHLDSTTFATAARTDGQDIVITDSLGNLIPREIPHFAKTDDIGELWYRDSSITTSANGFPLFVQWGGGSVNVNDTSGAWAVCHGGSVNYSLVMHFSGDATNYGPTTLTTFTRNTPTYASSAGPLGQHVVLDGVNQWVGVLHDAVLAGGNGSADNPLTIMAWVYHDDFGAQNNILCKGVAATTIDYQLSVAQTTGASQFATYDGAVTVRYIQIGKRILATSWDHLAVIYSGTPGVANQVIYRNTTDIDSSTANLGSYTAMDGDADTLAIGRYTSVFMDGSISDMAIAQVALSAQQLQNAYANQSGFATNASLVLSGVDSFASATVTANPTNDTVCDGYKAVFAVTASGSGTVAYQWQLDNVDIEGSTESTCTTEVLTTADNGATYRCIVSNDLGGDTSAAATVTVNSCSRIRVLGLGQSNAMGVGVGAATTRLDTLQRYWNAVEGAWFPMVDPIMDSAANVGDVDYYAGTLRAGPWISMFNGLRTRHPHDTLDLVLCAGSGAGLFYTAISSKWNDRGAGSIFHQAISRCSAASFVPNYIVFAAGESDALNNYYGTAWSDSAKALAHALRDTLDAGKCPVLFSMIGRKAGGTDSAQSHIRAEIASCDSAADSLFLGASYFDCAVNTGDTIHLSAAGQATHGRRISETVAYLEGDRPTYRGPRATAAWVYDSAVVAVALDRTPAANAAPTGFSLMGITADSARISGSRVLVYAAEAVDTSTRVRYAWGLTPNVSAAVYSTDSIARPLEPFDVVSSTGPTAVSVSPARGNKTGNTVVRITGTKLGNTRGGGSVSICTTYVSWSDTLCVCRTRGDSVLARDVVITTRYGKASTLEGAFTYANIISGFDGGYNTQTLSKRTFQKRRYAKGSYRSF